MALPITTQRDILPHVKLEAATRRRKGQNRGGVMKKSPDWNQKGGSLAPNQRDANQRGWSSERVTQGAMGSRRRASLAGLTPFNSGRTLPSKWDEAERWICSPVSGGYVCNNNNTKASHGHPHRRPKSKSGPIVPPPNGMAFYSNYSPTVIEGLGIKNLMAASPFSTGVLAPDAFSVHHHEVENGVRFPCQTVGGIGLMPLCSAPRWSDLLCDPSSPNSQEERDDDDDDSKNKNAEMSPISKRDKGTQMSPESEDDEQLPAISSPTLATDQQSGYSTKMEVRDVEVDSQAPIIRWSNRHATKMTKNTSPQVKSFRETSTEAEASSWDIVAADSTINASKAQREEAKINAWENLQKAKAEAAIRKLEMKLEKKRSASMDKILNKLRWAQMKAEKMRGSTPEQRGHGAMKIFKFAQIWPRRSCFSS